MLEAETIERQPRAPERVRPRLPQAAARHPTLGFVAAIDSAVASRRLFVLSPFAMIAGLIAYASLPGEPHPWALLGVAAALGAGIAVWRNAARLPLAALLAAGWFGFCLLPLHGHWFGTTMLVYPAYGLYQARVDEIISATDEAQRVVVSGLVPLAGDRALPIARARLFAPGSPALAPGDVVSANLRLAPVPGPILPGAFDSQFHAYFAGIGAYGTVTSDLALIQTGSSWDSARAIETLRMAIGNRIDTVLSGASAAIGRAMVMGDQSAIDDETREVMAAAGLAHIYSISGLHLSIVAGGLYFLVRLGLASIPATASRWPVKKLAAFTGIVTALGYLLLAGGLANVPALRSTIMLGLIFGAVLAGRRALTMRNVALAALAIVVIDPASVFRASFQLSFAAVVALIGYYEMPRQPADTERTWPGRLWLVVWTTAMTSLIAGSATLLFSAYHFQQTAPLGVLGNVLVLPVVSLVIMPFAVLSVLTMPFGLEAPFIVILGWGIDRMVDGAVLVAGWSEGLTGNPLLTGWSLIIGLAALAWFAFINNWWRLVGPVLALPLILLFAFDQRPDILVADTTQAVAFRDQTGLGLITGRTGSFATDVWSQHYQEPIAESLAGTRCDSLACIAQTEDFSVSVVRNPAAFAEDCGRHDLVITRIRVPVTCQGSQIIDADRLSTGGVHWLRWNDASQAFDIRSAVPNQKRPWRITQ